jgi:shikimate kinase
MICRGEGRSIPEIFRERGEPHFRLKEREALIAVTAIPRLVVATGGGTYVAEENRNLVEAAGWSVWLQVSLAEALRRAAGGDARPLMASRAEVEGIFRFRQEFYRCARLRIDTERLPPGKVAPAILEGLFESGFQPA